MKICKLLNCTVSLNVYFEAAKVKKKKKSEIRFNSEKIHPYVTLLNGNKVCVRAGIVE